MNKLTAAILLNQLRQVNLALAFGQLNEVKTIKALEFKAIILAKFEQAGIKIN